MHNKTKTRISLSLVTMLLLSMVAMFPIITVNASPDGTYFSVVNANLKFRDGTDDTNYGTHYFNYTNVKAPPNGTGYALGYLLVNLTVTDVTMLKLWQFNITWNPTLLEIAAPADIYVPADHIFSFAVPGPLLKSINNAAGTAFWGYGAGVGSVPDHYNGTGVCCQIKFKIKQEPSSALSCDLHLVTAGFVITKLVGPGGAALPFTAEDGHYLYEYIVPPLPKTYLEVYPSTIDPGLPMGPPIIGTPKAFFDIEIRIDEVVNASALVCIQFQLYYNTTLLAHVTQPSGKNATEGPFMNQTWEANRANSWAQGILHNGTQDTYFFTKEGPGGPGDIVVLVILGPGAPPNDYNWNKFPDTSGLTGDQRVVCSIEFEVLVQEEYPWKVCDVFDIEPLPYEYFVNSTYGYIEYDPEEDGEYCITGWILGRQIDVYTQYPYPNGGQGINQTSDMFEPQKTVILCANLSYNADPVQSKPVTFQIIPPEGSSLPTFIRTGITDEDGHVCVSFGIPWPCEDPETEIFGIWTVIAKADIMCTTTEDWLWFKIDYYVMNLEVTPTEDEFKKGTEACFWITFDTYKEIPVDVLITLVVYDDLGVPVGSTSTWVSVGGVERENWCQTKPYNITLCIMLPKWAFAGIGTIYVSALTDWPIYCGRAYCPEATNTFIIIKYT